MPSLASSEPRSMPWRVSSNIARMPARVRRHSSMASPASLLLPARASLAWSSASTDLEPTAETWSMMSGIPRNEHISCPDRYSEQSKPRHCTRPASVRMPFSLTRAGVLRIGQTSWPRFFPGERDPRLIIGPPLPGWRSPGSRRQFRFPAQHSDDQVECVPRGARGGAGPPARGTAVQRIHRR